MGRAGERVPPDEVRLRPVVDGDLPVFYEHQRDPVATRMAAFPSREREAFLDHWAKIRRDDSVTIRTILVDGRVAGNVVSFFRFGKREVGYWIGREDWGKGIASRALNEFLSLETTRPLFARVAKHNAGSIRVLEKCGFTVSGDPDEEARQVGDGIEEFLMELNSRPVDPLPARVRRAVREPVEIVPYDPRWPESFRREKEHLLSVLPGDLVGRIEHFGSTAIPGMAAKPVVDMLVEVSDLAATRARIVPILESLGYEYFWRPTRGDDGPPFYAWFVKRDERGRRTHHIHMVERTFREHWDRLKFRDHLAAHAEAADAYRRLKMKLAAEHPRDRVAYTQGKSAFIAAIMEKLVGDTGAGSG